MKEHAVLFGKANSLVGVLTDPSEETHSPNLPAVLLLNSGLVHHVGPNRVYVKIARKLAELGFVTFRFDFSGVGDSDIRRDHLPFNQSVISETQEAMDYLSTVRDIHQFILMGICSGAATSFRAACCDSRIAGLVLINARGHLHGNDDESRTYLRNRTLLRHYWRIILHSSFSTKNWIKAFTGKVDYRSILKMMFGFPLRRLFHRNHQASSVSQKAVADLHLLTERGVRLFLIHSEGDEGLDYLHVALGKELQTWMENGKVKFELIQGANHTFTLLWSQEYLLRIIHNWVRELVEDDVFLSGPKLNVPG